MDQLAQILRFTGYHAALIYPMLPTYALLICSAVTPIYTGAHASLTRPPSTAKPKKLQRKSDIEYDESEDEDDDDENTTKMEGLGPMDAIFIPITAGLSLGGLYLLIKWLNDPAILSKIISAYFSLFGTVAIASLGTDIMNLIHSLIFPEVYRWWGSQWTADSEHRLFKTVTDERPGRTRSSPLPGPFSVIPLPQIFKQSLWVFRETSKWKFHVKIHIHNFLTGSLRIGPYGIISATLAVTISLYTNFIHTPWYLNNLSACAVVYSVFQVVTPTTAWTADLILGGLFLYDIYFVFYTPLMVTVATSLDIPAKMLFPRPEGMSMLGLGDIAIPGMIMGFALRFDLWLYYFRQQRQKSEAEMNGRVTRSTSKHAKEEEQSTVLKPRYHPATGHWGTRFWAGSSQPSDLSSVLQGKSFPKPYFHATLTGYILGLVCTLLVMQIFRHAQPALLYLVPGVLGALWITAFVRGEAGILWKYRDDLDNDGFTELEGQKQEKGWWDSLRDSFTRTVGETKKQVDNTNGTPVKGEAPEEQSNDKSSRTSKDKREPWHNNQLIFFSVSFPTKASSPKNEGSVNSTPSTSSNSTPTKSPKSKENGTPAQVKRRSSRRVPKKHAWDSENESI